MATLGWVCGFAGPPGAALAIPIPIPTPHCPSGTGTQQFGVGQARADALRHQVAPVPQLCGGGALFGGLLLWTWLCSCPPLTHVLSLIPPLGLLPYVRWEMRNGDCSNPRDSRGSGVAAILHPATPGAALAPAGPSSPEAMVMGAFTLCLWAGLARQREGEPSLGRGRMGLVGLGSTQDPARMGCWRGGGGHTRCGVAAFEPFHLLTRAITTKRVIGTRCSGAAAHILPARLAWCVPLCWRGGRLADGVLSCNGFTRFALSQAARCRNRLQ